MKTFKVSLSAEDIEKLRGKTDNEEVIKALAYIDKEREWKARLQPVLTERELIAWELIASIVENQTTGFHVTSSNLYGTDLMGFRQKEYKSGRKTCRERVNEINGQLITSEGWGVVLPWIQKALDFLQVPFEAKKSGLVCSLGEFRLEDIYTDPTTGKEYRMFAMGHGASGFAGACSVVFSSLDWYDIKRFPKRSELVNVEGWKVCSNCGQPRRPKEQ